MRSLVSLVEVRSVLSRAAFILALGIASFITQPVKADVILDSPFWRGQLGSLQDRITILDGRTAADVSNFVWTELPSSLRGNPYNQLNLVTLNAMNTQIQFGTTSSLALVGNSYRPGTNVLTFGDTWANPSVMHGFQHEARHAVQTYFQHPSMAAANIRSGDIIHEMVREFDACLPPHAGNTGAALSCMIDRHYINGIEFLRDAEPGLTDLQRIGMGLHISANCPGGIIVGEQFTSCAISHYDDALRAVQGPGFRLAEDATSASRLLILPGAVTPATEGRLARLLGKVGRSRLMKYLPFVGIAAGLYAAEEARAQGDYVQACVEVGGLFPVIGEGQALGELVVKPVAEATGVIDAVGDILTPVAYVAMYGELPPEDQPLYSNQTLESYRRSAVDWLSDRLVWLFVDGDDLKGFNPCGKTKTQSSNDSTRSSLETHHSVPVQR